MSIKFSLWKMYEFWRSCVYNVMYEYQYDMLKNLLRVDLMLCILTKIKLKKTKQNNGVGENKQHTK